MFIARLKVTSVLLVHFIGAFMCLGFGLFYQWAQTAVSFRMFPLYNGIRICRIRTFLSVLSTLAFISCKSINRNRRFNFI
uniref:Secreted peptide n=1 Tax=Romanomermis culicivorax TaxID=13658 RepID=A0A915J0D0_ROMCU